MKALLTQTSCTRVVPLSESVPVVVIFTGDPVKKLDLQIESFVTSEETGASPPEAFGTCHFTICRFLHVRAFNFCCGVSKANCKLSG